MTHKVVEFIEHTSVPTKVVTDVGAIGIAWGAFFSDVVPAVAAILSVVWLALQIYTFIINKKWRKM